MPLEEELRGRSHRLAAQLAFYRTCVILATFSSTILGMLNRNALIPILVAIGAALQTWIDFQSLPTRLSNVNQALASIQSEVLWFKALDLVQQALPANLDHLMQVVEEGACAESSALAKSAAKASRPSQKEEAAEEEGKKDKKEKKAKDKSS